jgi:amidohydrolase
VKRRTLCLFVVIALLSWPRPAQAEDELLVRARTLAEQGAPQVVAWRRELHAHPELSNREQRTAQSVAEALREIGITEIRTGVAHHGVVALIRGSRPSPVVALRADMDALPVQEATGLPFASKNPGVMHACGHDGHTAMLLGAAQVLFQLRESLPGSVKLIFQPAEEGVPPGEEGGAALMIKQGVLRDPNVGAIFGLHVAPDLPTGTVAYRAGGMLASVDRFRVVLRGRQSHAAMPWQGADPIVAAAHVITAVHTIASHKVDARQPVVVSIGVLRGGEAWNIIPEQVLLEGTVRTHDQTVREQVARLFRTAVEQSAAAHGVVAEIEFSDYGPSVWNDPALVARMLPTLARVVGEANAVESPPVMVGEDFAHYGQVVPGMFLFLGVRNEAVGAVHPLHTPRFVLDEAALPVGVRTLSQLAIDWLIGNADDSSGGGS